MLFSCSSLSACDALQEDPGDSPGEFGDEEADADSPMREDDPSWVRDSEVAFCFKCDVKFSSSKRRHHCRRCRNIFCGKCSSHKSKILANDVMKHVRVCSDCFMDLIQENRVIGETLPFLRGGDTFKMKSMMGLSSRIVTLRLMTDNSTLMYEDDSRRDIVEMRMQDIDDIVPTSFDSFDIIASGRTHSFIADSKQTQQAWIHALRDAVNRSLEPTLRQRVERLRMEKKERHDQALADKETANMEMNAMEQTEAIRIERKQKRESIRQKYKLQQGGGQAP